MKKIPKSKLSIVFPVEIQYLLPIDREPRCTNCFYPIAGPGEVYLKDATVPFCRPECAWEWAQANGVQRRELPKPVKTPRKKKTPEPTT